MAGERGHPKCSPARRGAPGRPVLGNTAAWPQAQPAQNQTHPAGHGHGAAISASGRTAARPKWPMRPPAPGPFWGALPLGHKFSPPKIRLIRTATDMERLSAPAVGLPPGPDGHEAAGAGRYASAWYRPCGERETRPGGEQRQKKHLSETASTPHDRCPDRRFCASAV